MHYFWATIDPCHQASANKTKPEGGRLTQPLPAVLGPHEIAEGGGSHAVPAAMIKLQFRSHTM